MPYAGSRKQVQIIARDKVLDLGSRTLIMGVLNVTPDSFSDGGAFFDAARAVDRAWSIAEEGADILDIGGESTRPGSEGVSVEEELSRVMPVLAALAGKYPLPISIDTSKSEVGRAALECGAALVNDVSALRKDPALGRAAASCGAGVILMHMRGEPRTMQKMLPSRDILGDLEEWGGKAAGWAESLGVDRERIILDPGIGFGKTASQNLEILRNLDRLASLGFPIMIGTSRKSFIGRILSNPNADRVWGTAATVAISILCGAHIVRVHDVGAMRDVARVTDALLNERVSE
ncbi:MAG: dihydropteroate synthase [Acidobacteriota bacterium]|jgi:dihydropteroate synthase